MPAAINLIYDRYEVFAFEQLTVSNSSKALTSGTYIDADNNSAIFATVTLDDYPIRYRLDGSDPTASVGHILNPGLHVILVGKNNIKNFRAIRQGQNDAIINVSYQH